MSVDIEIGTTINVFSHWDSKTVSATTVDKPSFDTDYDAQTMTIRFTNSNEWVVYLREDGIWETVEI